MQSTTQANAPVPREAGNARLRQVRTFIEQAESVQPDLMQMVIGALRGRLLIGSIIGTIIGLCLAIALFMSIAPVFQSQGMMRIVARETKILYADSDDSRVRLFDAFVLAEVNYLSSRPVLERTLAKLQAQGIPNVPVDVGDLAKMMQVTGQKGLMTIVAKSGAGQTAAAAVNGLMDSYMELRLQQSEGQQNFRAQELASREKNLLSQLQAIDNSILEVGREYGPDSIVKEHANKIVQLDEAERRADELTGTINQLETVGYSLDSDTGDAQIKRSMLLDNSMASMTYDRAKKAAELATLSKRYRPDHPKVVSAQAEIAVLDKAIASRSEQIATLGRTGALTQGGDQKSKQSLQELKALQAKMQQRRKELETEALDLNSRIIRLGYLKEERAQARANLDQTRGALEEVRVESRNATPGVTEVVARGSVPDRPFEDKRKAMASIGFAGGIGIGFGLVGLWGLLRPTIRNERDISSLGKSVVSAGTFCSALHPVHGLRNILHLGLSRMEPGHGKVIAVIGGARDQGVTTLARALAASFHHAGSRTALVDGHLGKPDLTELSGAAGERGLTDWVVDRRVDSLPLSEDQGVTVLPAGSGRAVRDHTLSPLDIRHAMDELAEKHDVIIADCGAAKQVLSSVLFAAHCDVVLMVFRRGIAFKDARSATAAVTATSRKQVLVVLTGRPDSGLPHWMTKALRVSRNRMRKLTINLKDRLTRRA
jgi:succinoglycan biosynthesis transport protein ExoP